MEKGKLYLHTKHAIAPVNERIFGGFLEHLGRAVYEGVYDPTSVHADEDGFRTDVMEALRGLKFTAMRYPGGNFASDYHFENGIGKERQTIIDYAWQSIDDNSFGTDEFMKLCKKMDWEPMLTVNLGTGTPEEARNWVEYCNAPLGGKYSDLRVENGHAEPYNVKLWCLGNEMDSIWQLGHVPAKEYAIRAQQASKMMKDVDPSIELVCCGSCSYNGDTYLSWDSEVLEYIKDYTDYISLHRYVGNHENNPSSYFYLIKEFDRQIEDVAATCAYIQAKIKSKKRVKLCFDEWNVWYKGTEMNGNRQKAPHLLEEVYNHEDALICAGMMLSFLRHADTIQIANIAQIVNVIAPILTNGDKMLKQSSYYAFQMVSERRKGVSLHISADVPELIINDEKKMESVYSAAILNNDTLQVFLTNYSNKDIEMTIDIAGNKLKNIENCEILKANDLKDANTYENTDLVKSCAYDGYEFSNNLVVKLPAYSFVVLTCIII